MKSNFLAVVALAIGGAIAWEWTTEAPLAHFAVGIDHSLSVRPNCAGLRELSAKLVEQAEERGEGREGSTLALMVMGSDPRAPEPNLLSSSKLPVPSGVVYGQDPEKFRREREAYFAGIEQGCEALETSRHSPIYRLVKQGVAHLRSLGCTAEGGCYLVIKTDLVEDVELALRQVIEPAAKDPSVALPPELAGSIDNAGIGVTFCGTAEMQAVAKAKQAPASAEVRARIWQGLFTNPDSVSFTPFCGQPAR